MCRLFIISVILILDFPRCSAFHSGERSIGTYRCARCLLALRAEPLPVGHRVQRGVKTFDVIWMVALGNVQPG